jgi:hypothetical protein
MDIWLPDFKKVETHIPAIIPDNPEQRWERGPDIDPDSKMPFGRWHPEYPRTISRSGIADRIADGIAEKLSPDKASLWVYREYKWWTSNPMSCPGTVYVVLIAQYWAVEQVDRNSLAAALVRVHEAVEEAAGNVAADAQPGPKSGPRLLAELAQRITCPGSDCVWSEEDYGTHRWSLPLQVPKPAKVLEFHRPQCSEYVYFAGVKKITCAKRPVEGGSQTVLTPPASGTGPDLPLGGPLPSAAPPAEGPPATPQPPPSGNWTQPWVGVPVSEEPPATPQPPVKEPTRRVGSRVSRWGVGGAVVAVGLVAAVAFGQGTFGTAQQHPATPIATAAPTATATPNPTQQVLQLVTRFGNDLVHDNGADAHTLITPQLQAQMTVQQLTAILKAPPGYIFDAFAIDPTSVRITGTSATARGTLTETCPPNNTVQRVVYAYQVDQQPDGSWRVASEQPVSH